ncbi:hypothetical protein EEL33_01260 [Muribaculaceae bacterium Isolate-037 (Harlan)]|nr:hypothetical protein EEL33_01260 [Muribaculaceae bacterium Isolate-037 (Harlan)]
MAENNPVISKRDQHLERLRKRYPEKQFEDDEEIFGQISDDYDAFEQENSAMKEREKSMSNMFRENPQAAFFLNDMREGKDPVMSLVRRLGIEVKDVMDDPAMQDKIESANKEYLDRVAKSRQLDEEYERNMETTLNKTLPEYQQEHGLSDEEMDAIGAAWIQIIREGIMGILSPETITLMANAINHDTDVANAQEEGEVAGRNSKIVEQLRRSKKGDGIQNLNGRNGTPRQNPDKTKSVFDLAREAD